MKIKKDDSKSEWTALIDESNEILNLWFLCFRPSKRKRLNEIQRRLDELEKTLFPITVELRKKDIMLEYYSEKCE